MAQVQQYIQSIYDAVMHHQWWMLASLVLMAMTALIRWGAPKVHGKLGAWLQTDHGAITLVFTTSILGGLATAFAGGVKPTFETLQRSLVVAISAAVSYPTVRKFLTSLFGAGNTPDGTSAVVVPAPPAPPPLPPPPDEPTAA